jgi:hypothetical protein
MLDNVKVGQHVIIYGLEQKYYGVGAEVVSEAYSCVVHEVPTQVVAVKVFYQEWGLFSNNGEWHETILIISIHQMKPDTYHAFEKKRLKMKFGGYWSTELLAQPLNREAECAFCGNRVHVRIEMNHSGCIRQYDVCRPCAKRWDGVWSDCPPEKKVKAV